MSSFILLLIRHGIAALAAYLAAHGFAMDGGPTTASLIVGLCIMGIASVWSWLSKMLKLDYDISVYNSTALKTALGSLVSQGITFASAYYAVDANDPSALAVAVINAVASHYGVHQQIAFQTPIEKAAAIKLLMLGSVISLSSCATASAIMSSSFGRAVIASADQLAAQVVKTTERVGLEQIIMQASAKVAVLHAQGVNPDPVKETLRLSEIAGFTSVVDLAQDKYKALTGARFTLPKNPASVLP